MKTEKQYVAPQTQHVEVDLQVLVGMMIKQHFKV